MAEIIGSILAIILLAALILPIPVAIWAVFRS